MNALNMSMQMGMMATVVVVDEFGENVAGTCTSHALRRASHQHKITQHITIAPVVVVVAGGKLPQLGCMG